MCGSDGGCKRVRPFAQFKPKRGEFKHRCRFTVFFDWYLHFPHRNEVLKYLRAKLPGVQEKKRALGSPFSRRISGPEKWRKNKPVNP
jgi:hypothetical protein